MRLAVVGSVNVDSVVRCERLPAPGETTLGHSIARLRGGKGANQAVAAARLGTSVSMVGCVGDDPDGDWCLAGLRGAGVDVSRVQRRPEPTGCAVVTVADDGENEIVVVPGANRALRPSDVELGSGEAVLCQLEVPVSTVLAAAHHARGPFFLNASPATELPDEIVDRADLTIVNAGEFERLSQHARRRRVVVTHGAAGASLWMGGREQIRSPAPRVAAVDSTGAGDAFTAALVTQMLMGTDHAAALRWACATGALVAMRVGAQESLPTAAEVRRIIRAGRCSSSRCTD